MRRHITVALGAFLILTVLSIPALGADSVLVRATRGKLRSFVGRVIEADNKTLEGLMIDPDRGDLEFSGFRPDQIKHLTSFIAHVNTYKSSLNSAFSLFSSGMRGADYYEQHEGNMPFGAADEFYRTTITNPGVSNVPAFGTGGPPDRNDIFNTTNYLYYTAAMFAKSEAAGNIFEVMWIDGGYSKAEMEQVIRDGIQSAKYVYSGAPSSYTQPETLKARDEIIAAFNEKLERIEEAHTTASSVGASRKLVRNAGPVTKRTRTPSVRSASKRVGSLSGPEAKASKKHAKANYADAPQGGTRDDPHKAASTKFPVRKPTGGSKSRTTSRQTNVRPSSNVADSPSVDEAKVIDERVETGNKLAGEGKWAEAVEAYRLAALAHPESAEIQDLLGDAYMNAGRYKEAFASYEEAIRLAPQDPVAHYKLGAAYITMGQYGDSFQPFQKALRFDPTYAEAYFGIGHAYVYLEEYGKALPFLRSAIRLEPDLAEAHYDLALVYDAQGDVNAVRKEQAILEKLDPEMAKQLSNALR